MTNYDQEQLKKYLEMDEVDLFENLATELMNTDVSLNDTYESSRESFGDSTDFDLFLDKLNDDQDWDNDYSDDPDSLHYKLPMDSDADFLPHEGHAAGVGNIAISWFERNMILFYGLLCVENKLRERLNESALSDKLTLGTAILDIIASVSWGIPPFAVTALLVKVGVNQLCKCNHELDADYVSGQVEKASAYISTIRKERTGENLSENDAKKIRILKAVIQSRYEERHMEILERFEVEIPPYE